MQRRPCRDEAREEHVASRAAHGLEVDVGQGTRSGDRGSFYPSRPLEILRAAMSVAARAMASRIRAAGRS